MDLQLAPSLPDTFFSGAMFNLNMVAMIQHIWYTSWSWTSCLRSMIRHAVWGFKVLCQYIWMLQYTSSISTNICIDGIEVSIHCFYISCLINIVYTFMHCHRLYIYCIIVYCTRMSCLINIGYTLTSNLFPILNHKLRLTTRCLERTILWVSRTQTKRAADTNWKRSRMTIGPVILLHLWEVIPKHQSPKWTISDFGWNDWGMLVYCRDESINTVYTDRSSATCCNGKLAFQLGWSVISM